MRLWIMWLELNQFLDAVQYDLVGAAAVLRSIWGCDGQDPRHPQLVPLLLHRDPVLLQPPPDNRPPPSQLLQVQLAGPRGEKGGLETLCGLLISLLQDLHLLHSMPHHHLHRCSTLLPEVHQDQTVVGTVTHSQTGSDQIQISPGSSSQSVSELSRRYDFTSLVFPESSLDI